MRAEGRFKPALLIYSQLYKLQYLFMNEFWLIFAKILLLARVTISLGEFLKIASNINRNSMILYRLMLNFVSENFESHHIIRARFANFKFH